MASQANDRFSPEYLRSILEYDPSTGCLSWKFCEAKGKNWNRKCAGVPALRNNGAKGYAVGNIDRKSVMAHRVAWVMYYGEWPKGQIDHIDGNKRNNKIENLRDVEPLENCRNLPIQRNNKSGITGVHWDSDNGRWAAQITILRKSIRLGRFTHKADAIAARKAGERKFGFHPNHGRPRQILEQA